MLLEFILEFDSEFSSSLLRFFGLFDVLKKSVVTGDSEHLIKVA